MGTSGLYKTLLIAFTGMFSLYTAVSCPAIWHSMTGGDLKTITSFFDRTPTEKLDDDRITSEVQRLLSDEITPDLNFNVFTYKGSVTLQAKIAPKEQSKAVELAQTVSGVKSVTLLDLTTTSGGKLKYTTI